MDMREKLEFMEETKEGIKKMQRDIHNTGTEIKTEIIEDRNYDLLTVNYARLNRVYEISGKVRVR